MDDDGAFADSRRHALHRAAADVATIKAWMGATHFRLRTLEKVSGVMSFHVLAHNLKRIIAIFGVQPLIQAMRAV